MDRPSEWYTIYMDIAALSMGLAQAEVADQVGTRILANSLDLARERGEDVVALISSAAMPPLEEGSGGLVDSYA